MDDADHAALHAERERDEALARQLRQGRLAPRPSIMNGLCQDCGRAIPAARRAALPGALRCIGCQDDFERGW